jgi:hypothetical protein
MCKEHTPILKLSVRVSGSLFVLLLERERKRKPSQELRLCMRIYITCSSV